MDLARCDEIGYRQDGLITRLQALTVLSADQIAYFVEQGVWHQVYRGVYRMTGVADTWERRVRAATLLRNDILASGRTAAYLWGIMERRPPDVELLAPFTSSARLPETTLRRTRTWADDFRSAVDGIPVTTVARTLIDITPHSSLSTIKRSLDLAITRRRMPMSALSNELSRIGTRGRKNISVLLDLLPQYGNVANIESIGEIDVRSWIAGAGLPLPVAQLRIPVGKHDTFRPDFAYPEQKIAIEVQSWTWHGGPAQYANDAKKATSLAAMGWLTIPVLPRQENRATFIQALSRALESR